MPLGDKLSRCGKRCLIVGLNPGATQNFMDVESVRYKLSKLVNENQLQTFYSPQAVQDMARQVAQKNLTGMARQWQLPSQVTFLPMSWIYCH